MHSKLTYYQPKIVIFIEYFQNNSPLFPYYFLIWAAIQAIRLYSGQPQALSRFLQVHLLGAFLQHNPSLTGVPLLSWPHTPLNCSAWLVAAHYPKDKVQCINALHRLLPQHHESRLSAFSKTTAQEHQK